MARDSYCTTDEYEVRYGEVDDVSMLQECLDDCSAVIDMELARHGRAADTSDEGEADRLMRVCRSMANRVMPSATSGVPQGVTQMGVTAGSYSEQFTFQSSYGTPKLIDSERILLGIKGGRVGWAPLGRAAQ